MASSGRPLPLPPATPPPPPAHPSFFSLLLGGQTPLALTCKVKNEPPFALSGRPGRNVTETDCHEWRQGVSRGGGGKAGFFLFSQRHPPSPTPGLARARKGKFDIPGGRGGREGRSCIGATDVYILLFPNPLFSPPGDSSCPLRSR